MVIYEITEALDGTFAPALFEAGHDKGDQEREVIFQAGSKFISVEKDEVRQHLPKSPEEASSKKPNALMVGSCAFLAVFNCHQKNKKWPNCSKTRN